MNKEKRDLLLDKGMAHLEKYPNGRGYTKVGERSAQAKASVSVDANQVINGIKGELYR